MAEMTNNGPSEDFKPAIFFLGGVQEILLVFVLREKSMIQSCSDKQKGNSREETCELYGKYVNIVTLGHQGSTQIRVDDP